MNNIYDKDRQAAIAFPLGGIGTGCISLAGNGQLVDWELFGRPNKDSTNEYTHFAIKCENEREVIDARVLHGDTVRDFYGSGKGHHQSWGYGQGPNRTTLAGLPHFEKLEFSGIYPFASLSFADSKMPAEITMEAFNPFIPMNDYDSSLPAAFFNFKITNTSDEILKYTVAFSLGNIFEKGAVNEFSSGGGLSFATLSSGLKKSDPKYGSLTMATDNDNAYCQEYWYRGGWFDDVTMFWNDFTEFGKIKNRHYDYPGKAGEMCTLTACVEIKPGKTENVRFVLSWHIPTFQKYWGSPNAKSIVSGIVKGKRSYKPTWERYYTKFFENSKAVASYSFKHRERLYNDSRRFKNALSGSSLPCCVSDAIQGNIAILKSITCLRLADGEFYAFEGSGSEKGSCEGTCSHVWGYAYAMPFLFPKLERSLRELDYKYNCHDNGSMDFRLMLPLGSRMWWNIGPCVDGQYGGIIRIYREWKISGDDEWLSELWPGVKKSIEWAWSCNNHDRWDREKSGCITGRQHHTLDVELFGANSWLTGYYLAALKAGSIMAEKMGDTAAAAEYIEIFEKGKIKLENELFNGRHYIQKIDLNDKSFIKSLCKNAKEADFYWDEDNGEVKYQIKEGCEIDQIIGQWHATLNGLGDIFNSNNRKKAVAAIYEINFKRMRDMANPCRIFALDDEKGLVICDWEKDKYKPHIPIPYTQETMCGFEYAAACTMIQEGFEKEGLEVVAAVRERYDGKKRNPWSEIECGSSYARSMASYSLLLTYSGFEFDMTRNMIGFNPIHFDEQYNTFWSVQKSWGVFKREKNKITIDVCFGDIKLKTLLMPKGIKSITDVKKDGKSIQFCFSGRRLEPEVGVFLRSNEKLIITAVF